MSACRLAWLLLLPAGVAGADAPAFDRPGIAFAPSVLAPGTLSWEQGLPDISRDRDSGTRTTLYSADTLLRAGLGQNTELQFGTSLNRQISESPGSNQHTDGMGDSSLAIKLALPALHEDLSWALLGRVTLASGRDALSNGTTQYLLGSSMAWALEGGESLGAYLCANHMKGQDSYTFSPNIGFPVSDTLEAYMEAGLTHGSHAGNREVAGGGLAWMATPAIQFDASADWGLKANHHALQAGVGVSVYFQ